MEKISDTVTSVFHIAIMDKRPAVCPSDGTIVWSETFGLGYRFGISHNSSVWSRGIRLYLDHNQSQTEQDQATVAVSLRDAADKDASAFKEKVTTILDFGHGEHVHIGSWSTHELALHPYLSLTLTTKARLSTPITTPLPSTSLALRQSLDSGDFVDTKFYVFSAKSPGSPARRPRVVYANSDSIGMVLPKSTLRAKKENKPAPAFLVDMTSDRLVDQQSVLHEYEYEQDSDLDDEPEAENDPGDSAPRHNPPPDNLSSSVGADNEVTDDEFTGPPAYSAKDCRMVLVKGVAYKTWLSYIHFRYTGQVFFRPLKSARVSLQEPLNHPAGHPSCSAKSMYRLAVNLGDERMKELACRAIYQGLSKDNITEEAFSWFTAQYTTISEYEVEKVIEYRKSPEVSTALRQQIKAVSLGEKRWAQDVLIAIMEKLNVSEPST